MAQIPRRYPAAAKDRLVSLLGIAWEAGMQDWPLEVSDSSRLSEFCDAYEHLGLNDSEKFSLMALILYSLDEFDEIEEWRQGKTIPLVSRIQEFLIRDFVLHFYTVDYWRQPVEDDLENVFNITPLLRQVWEECYRPEYSRWLEEGYSLIWVFNGGSSFPSGVFTSRERAEEWINHHQLVGILTAYPLDIGAYDWMIITGHLMPASDDHKTPEFIANFGPPFLEQYHYPGTEHRGEAANT